MKKKINSILIANRGEIASRIIKTCQQMGITSIAVYSDIDKSSNYVIKADQAYYLGGNQPSESYLNIDKIISIAKKVKVDAIHPGYGFLSENVHFAKRCEKEKIIFIGPNIESMELMSSKSEARKYLKKIGVEMVPGYAGDKKDLKTYLKEAKRIGYPIIIKAALGGGGKGMRIVKKESDFKELLNQAQRESKNAFGDDKILIEKYITDGRHIEIQLLGDKHQNLIHLYERECTIQRRYQKIIEESPSTAINNSIRKAICDSALSIGKSLNYDSLGTVEYIYDNKTQKFYFLEVNTRLQVEHPVTEELIKLDLVKLQIEVALGEKLSLTQNEIKPLGHSLELRIYAEDPKNNFNPSSGSIEKFICPDRDNIRIETNLNNKSLIPIHYDPLLAKIITCCESREKSINKMNHFLSEMVILGIDHNQDFLKNILSQKDFIEGNYNTHYVQNNLESLNSDKKDSLSPFLICASLYDWEIRNKKRTLLKGMPSGWRNNFFESQKSSYILSNNDEIQCKYKFLSSNNFDFKILDNNYKVELIDSFKELIIIEIDNEIFKFHIIEKKNRLFIKNSKLGNFKLLKKDQYPIANSSINESRYLAPIPSLIISVLVKKNQKIKKNDPLIVISSMKMESTIIALKDGKVESILVKENQNVDASTELIKII